jgi:hypothetical protein
LSGKALNQDVKRYEGGILKSKELHSQTTINVSAGEMLKYTLQPLWMQKLEQEALFTFMESKTDQ